MEPNEDVEPENRELPASEAALIEKTASLARATAWAAGATFFLAAVTTFQVWKGMQDDKRFEEALVRFDKGMERIDSAVSTMAGINTAMANLAKVTGKVPPAIEVVSRKSPEIVSIDTRVCSVVVLSPLVYRLDVAESCSHIELSVKNPGPVPIVARVVLAFPSWECPATADETLAAGETKDFLVDIDECFKENNGMRKGTFKFAVNSILVGAP